MSRFVLDNSVAMRWLLASQKKADQTYAENVLRSLVETEAVVPNLWHLEAANVLITAERQGELEPGEVERFVAQIESLPIVVDPQTAHQVFSRGFGLSRAYKLSAYDAAYLELAIREGLPLATLDKNLMRAAKKADVEFYLK
jgi:predicted nucleic acid-binding protein